MSMQSDAGFTAFMGLDWADAKHDFCLQPRGGDVREFGTFARQPAAIEAGARALHQRFGGHKCSQRQSLCWFVGHSLGARAPIDTHFGPITRS